MCLAGNGDVTHQEHTSSPGNCMIFKAIGIIAQVSFRKHDELARQKDKTYIHDDISLQRYIGFDKMNVVIARVD